jgi:lipopolysaccharide transport system ATP-binding protein
MAASRTSGAWKGPLPTSSEIAIRVRGLSKQYTIGAPQERHTTLRERITAAAGRPWRRLTGRETVRGPVTTMWALRDVSFDVRRGEVIGVIGGNGAGKSTLLKILSRITEPTEGEAVIEGRVGSLLEVGTGFHQDLTGRENIFLNGAILGMRKAEIDRKFDEMVAFAGVEKFIDTPVRHYSSGMYVRLAFAVAAHMDPEILIVDEVLAVGDSQFQKKCLGKLDDVARGGRTVLFVSHNMAAIQRLCTSAILLDRGRLVKAGDVRSTVTAHLAAGSRAGYVAASLTGGVQILAAELTDERGAPLMHPTSAEPIVIRVDYTVPHHSPGLKLGIGVLAPDGVPLFTTNTDDVNLAVPIVPGRYEARVVIPAHALLAGDFHLAVCLWNDAAVLDLEEPALSFSVDAGASDLYRHASERKGFVHVDCPWTLRRADDEERQVLGAGASAGVGRL